MENTRNIKEWRSEELAKLYLLKSTFKLTIERYPTPLFDFLVTLNDESKIKFAVEVKADISFLKNIKQQTDKIKMYRQSGMITIPVVLIKIDDLKEQGEIDFLVLPSKTGKLLVRQNFNFKPLTTDNIDNLIENIIRWNYKQVKLIS